MALSTISFITSVENLLHKNNTTTSSNDISLSLNSRVKSFYKGTDGMYKNIPIPNTLYPAVIVEMASKPEQYRELGNSARRLIEANFSIVSITNYGAGTTTDDTKALETANIEVMRLAQNIEALIRTKPDLSLTSYVLQCNITDTEFGTIARDNGFYNQIAITKCMAQILST